MMADLERQFADGDIDVRGIAARLIDWTWKAIRDVPPDLLRTLEAMRHEDVNFGRLCDQYDRYERQLLAHTLSKVATRKSVPSPLVGARLLDLMIPTVAIWAKLHPNESYGVKKATLEMVVRYLENS